MVRLTPDQVHRLNQLGVVPDPNHGFDAQTRDGEVFGRFTVGFAIQNADYHPHAADPDAWATLWLSDESVSPLTQFLHRREGGRVADNVADAIVEALVLIGSSTGNIVDLDSHLRDKGVTASDLDELLSKARARRDRAGTPEPSQGGYHLRAVQAKRRRATKKRRRATKKRRRKLHTGPRGGRYYITKGRKVYV